jgi:hypothetical protein
MDALKHILIWQIWLLSSITIAVFLFLLVRLNAHRMRYGNVRPISRRRTLPVLLLQSLSLIGLGASLITLPYDFLDFLGGFLCVFGVQLAFASITWTISSDGGGWPIALCSQVLLFCLVLYAIDGVVKGNQGVTNEGYERGFKDGEEKGYQNGFAIGKEEGRKEGRNESVSFSKDANGAMIILGRFLNWIFANIFFPALVIAMFLYIFWSIVRIIRAAKKASDTKGQAVRITAGAALPLLILVFLIAARQDGGNPISEFFQSARWHFKILAGGLVGVALMVARARALGMESGSGPAVYALFLSTIGAFMLWSVMGGIVITMSSFFFGIVVGAVLIVVLYGYPEIYSNSRPPTT